jgi:hypothetical protein
MVITLVPPLAGTNKIYSPPETIITITNEHGAWLPAILPRTGADPSSIY